MNSITRNMRMCALLGAALVFVLSACGAAQPVEQAASSIESYLQARVAGNAEQMIALSCAAWESQARIEASSFQSMNAALDGVTCAVASSTASEALVHCTGRIVTSYNGESREWRMDERAFAAAIEGGEWQELARFPRAEFPGDPAALRIGKMSPGSRDEDFDGETGPAGECRIGELRVLGER